jgi:hypothetical protein
LALLMEVGNDPGYTVGSQGYRLTTIFGRLNRFQRCSGCAEHLGTADRGLECWGAQHSHINDTDGNSRCQQ